MTTNQEGKCKGRCFDSFSDVRLDRCWRNQKPSAISNSIQKIITSADGVQLFRVVKKMKVYYFEILGKQIILLTIFLSMVGSSSTFSQIVITEKPVDSFSKYNAGEFPKFWKTWPLQRNDAKQVYQVKEEGTNKYLAALDDKNLSEQIFKEFDWKLNAFPYLKWRWRAQILPDGGAENNGATNDSACSVYVVFGKTSGTALKFVWSTTLPVGYVHVKKQGEMMVEVLESGKGHLNQWQNQSIHIPNKYKELLKQEIGRAPTGIAILTDGNALHKPSACDYDNFMISSKP